MLLNIQRETIEPFLDLNDGDLNYKFFRSEFAVVCQDDKFKALEAEKFPWLDKGLNGGNLPDPINPDEFETGQCRSFDDWLIFENTTGGWIDLDSNTTDFDFLQRKALLTDDAVGIVETNFTYFLSLKLGNFSTYENETGTTFFKKPEMPCEICPKSVGWQGYNIDDLTICHYKPNEEGQKLKSKLKLKKNIIKYKSTRRYRPIFRFINCTGGQQLLKFAQRILGYLD